MTLFAHGICLAGFFLTIVFQLLDGVSPINISGGVFTGIILAYLKSGEQLENIYAKVCNKFPLRSPKCQCSFFQYVSCNLSVILGRTIPPAIQFKRAMGCRLDRFLHSFSEIFDIVLFSIFSKTKLLQKYCSY